MNNLEQAYWRGFLKAANIVEKDDAYGTDDEFRNFKRPAEYKTTSERFNTDGTLSSHHPTDGKKPYKDYLVQEFSGPYDESDKDRVYSKQLYAKRPITTRILNTIKETAGNAPGFFKYEEPLDAVKHTANLASDTFNNKWRLIMSANADNMQLPLKERILAENKREESRLNYP